MHLRCIHAGWDGFALKLYETIFVLSFTLVDISDFANGMIDFSQNNYYIEFFMVYVRCETFLCNLLMVRLNPLNSMT